MVLRVSNLIRVKNTVMVLGFLKAVKQAGRSAPGPCFRLAQGQARRSAGKIVTVVLSKTSLPQRLFRIVAGIFTRFFSEIVERLCRAHLLTGTTEKTTGFYKTASRRHFNK